MASDQELEAVARAIGDAIGEPWREPPYFGLYTADLNNRLRYAAVAAINAMQRKK